MTRDVLTAVRRADRELYERAARFDAPGLDAVLPRLSRAADNGLLWLGVAAVLAAAGGRSRRAATRGVATLSLASAVANGPAKFLVRRRRPALDVVPVLRLLRDQPRTTSFPSGHSASGAAFAAGAALEAPALGVPLGLLAGAVAYSRVHTGVHYPADVAAGVAVGLGAALVLRSTWPVRPDRAGAAVAPPCDAPALPEGDGLIVVVNDDAGSVDTERLRAEIAGALPRADLVICSESEKLADIVEQAAENATALGVAGGDGTVNCAASAALRRGVPLAVFPAGTLNHFAADLGIADVTEVIRAIGAGEAVDVSVGSAADDGADLFFLNTFSIGLYPEIVRRRERRQRWLGKWPSLALALAEVLRAAEPVDLDLDGGDRRVWLLFGGNGRYHPHGFAPSWRERLDEDVVDVRLVDAARPWARTRLVVAVLSGRLGRCRVYEERVVDSMHVHIRGDERLARDGEVHPAERAICLRPASRRLAVYRPAAG